MSLLLDVVAGGFCLPFLLVDRRSFFADGGRTTPAPSSSPESTFDSCMFAPDALLLAPGLFCGVFRRVRAAPPCKRLSNGDFSFRELELGVRARFLERRPLGEENNGGGRALDEEGVAEEFGGGARALDEEAGGVFGGVVEEAGGVERAVRGELRREVAFEDVGE